MKRILFLPLLFSLAACSGNENKTQPEQITLTTVDSILREFGGPLTDSLSRQQRWRMISSIGTGLPPQDYGISELPEPHSYGAAMLEVYCEQCHWLPSPQMHSAAEWPLLVRRMMLRAGILKDRIGGPVTRGLVGGWMVDIIKKVGYPDADQQDSIIAYLQRNALPVAKPGEVGQSPSARLFARRCSVCHETPSPSAHTAAEWPRVVQKMRSNMAKMDVQPLTAPEVDSVTTYLQAHGGGGPGQ